MIGAALAGRAAPALALLARLAWAAPWIIALGHLRPPLNGDVAAILYGAQRMLAGDVLYRDILDPNPPLIFALSLAPAAGARHLGGPIEAWTSGLALLAAAAALLLAWRILRPPSLVAAAALFAVLVLPAHNFAQREHLFVVLCLPWLACCAARLDGRAPPGWACVAAGLAAAVGCLIKPHFLALPVVVEAVMLARRGRARLVDREAWALLLGGIAVGLALLEAFPYYIAEMLPLALADYSDLGRMSPWEILTFEDRWPLLLAVIGLPAAAARADAASIERVAAAALVGATLEALVQGKGFEYHVLPAWTFAAIGLAALLARRIGAGHPLALAAVVALTIRVDPWIAHAEHPGGAVDLLTQRLAALPAEDRTVLFLSAAVYPQFPAIVATGAEQTMPWLNLWLLDALYAKRRSGPRPLDAMSDIERRLLDEVGRAIVEDRPRLLFAAPIGPHGLDPLAWAAMDPDTAAALANWREIGAYEDIRLLERR